jgi:hypothetical protein
MGRPAHRTTAERKRFVKKLASLMLKTNEIAAILGISYKTVERRYKKELDAGMAETHQSVSAKLVKQITSDDKSMSTAHQRVWFLNRYHPREDNDPGSQRPLVTVTLPRNGFEHPNASLYNGGLVRIIDAVANPLPKLVVGKAE